MKGMIFFVLLTSLLATGIWAYFLGSSDVATAGHDPGRGSLREAGQRLAERVSDTVRRQGAQPGAREKRLLLVAAMHAMFLVHVMPVILPALVGAAALGLARREAARTLAKFSSPTYAFAAKRVFFVTIVLLSVFALTPVAVPYWTVYAAAAVMAITLAIYVENIPMKI